MQETVFEVYRRRVLPYATIGIRIRDPNLALWLERMLVCFDDVRGLTALDYGAASGHKALLLAHLGARVIATDLDPAAVARMSAGAALSGVELDVRLGGAEVLLDLPSGSVQRVLLSEVIEHLPPQEVASFVSEVARIMAPGSRLFLTTPNLVCCGPAEDSREYYRRFPFGHYRHYSLTELRAYFDQPPFRTLDYAFWSHPLVELRNRVLYPLAYYDYAIRHSRRLPALRALLWPLLQLFYWSVETAYPAMLAIQRRYEAHRARQEATGRTIMLSVERI